MSGSSPSEPTNDIMITFELHRLDWTGRKCCNPNCGHSEKYHDHIIGDVYFLKQDQIVLFVYMGDALEIYCYDCIDILYKQMKLVLNKDLWAFQ